ncbi:MAG TPA: Ig domain-containing protein [Terriglobales bacterium]|nr:Ig domain-containing protein [Terriglobales bacterium]
MSRWIFLLLLTTGLAAQTADPARFQFVTNSLPNGMLGRPYAANLTLRNGAGPFEWRLTDGTLPPGLFFDTNAGAIRGTPSQIGDYRFSLTVRDLGTNEMVRHTFIVAIQNQLLLEWLKTPTLSSNTLSGLVKVTNNNLRGQTFNITVIIVAVNEIGKAFALGYQHFDLAESIEQTVPFSSTLPNGQYIVRVDAIAALPNKRQSSARTSLETPTPVVVNVNR